MVANKSDAKQRTKTHDLMYPISAYRNTYFSTILSLRATCLGTELKYRLLSGVTSEKCERTRHFFYCFFIGICCRCGYLNLRNQEILPCEETEKRRERVRSGTLGIFFFRNLFRQTEVYSVRVWLCRAHSFVPRAFSRYFC